MAKTCLNCGKTFEAQRSTKLYCSDVCRATYHQKNRPKLSTPKDLPKTELNCEVCGDTFETSRPGVARYCSGRCRKRASRARHS